MKTLVIHPYDPTTKFLDKIYKDKDWTILTSPNPSSKEIKEAIKAHDRIIMLGHGSGNGLYTLTRDSSGLIKDYRLIIDSKLVYLLRQKDCVCIWCNADEFVHAYRLHGKYTGMIISEYDECLMYSINATDNQIITSNNMFADIMAQHIDTDPDTWVDTVQHLYEDITNPVIAFNRDNIYCNLLDNSNV